MAKIDRITVLAARYLSKCNGTIINSGHSFNAKKPGIADLN